MLMKLFVTTICSPIIPRSPTPYFEPAWLVVSRCGLSGQKGKKTLAKETKKPKRQKKETRNGTGQVAEKSGTIEEKERKRL